MGSLSYAMFDFNISILVPLYRLPYQMSFWATYHSPNDTSQGEFDYDPFVYDVGTMGV